MKRLFVKVFSNVLIFAGLKITAENQNKLQSNIFRRNKVLAADSNCNPCHDNLFKGNMDGLIQLHSSDVNDLTNCYNLAMAYICADRCKTNNM